MKATTHRPRGAWPLLALPLLGCLVVLLAAAGHARAQVGARFDEAIVVKGQDLGSLQGAAVGSLQVWRLVDGQWRREAAQVDEKKDGDYVAADDQLLGADDELVFGYVADGQLAAEGQVPTGVAADAARAQIAVTDPLAGGAVSYLYAFAVAGASEPVEQPPAVDYDKTTRLFKGGGYALGLADPGRDGFLGLRELRLGTADVDLVDRLKIRGQLSALGFEQAVDEENLANLLQNFGVSFSAEPIKLGPVRSLAGGGATFYPQRLGLLGNLSALNSLGGGVPGLDFGLKDGRISLDLSPAAEGATYRDANLAAGVKVDGKPDVIPASPLPAWRELSFPMGRLVILTRPTAAAATARTYYKDDATLDGNDTGDDGQSWGDAGVAAPDVDGLLGSGFPGEMVILPAGSAVTAASLSAQYQQPLTVAVTSSGSQPATPTRAPSATRTAQPTGEPTVVPGTPTPGLGDITLNGTVFAGSIDGGRPLSGARISFQPCNPHQPFTTLSGADGAYQLLLPRDYVISCGASVPIEVSRAGYQTLKLSIPLVELFRQPRRDFALTVVAEGGKVYLSFLLSNASRP